MERVGSVLAGQDAMFNGERHRIAALAAAAGLPWVSGARENAEAGTVISYGVNLRENYRRAATYIDKILKGTKPGELPVELPTKLRWSSTSNPRRRSASPYLQHCSGMPTR